MPIRALPDVLPDVISAEESCDSWFRLNPATALVAQEAILKAQYALETKEPQQNMTVITWRSGADPIVYTLCYTPPSLGGRPMLEGLEQWRVLRERMMVSAVIVCPPRGHLSEEEEERTRELSTWSWKERVVIHDAFVRVLRENGINHRTLENQLVCLEDQAESVLRYWEKVGVENMERN
ncbi:hypothetical protein BJY04DRAFT_221768 [Aspergillus karnatakaensis]|uniref:uncharacterized protein n=1 Tax=Aspergillus karnatakaensis TaxID=1810916 RepID=UPI003CCD7C48